MNVTEHPYAMLSPSFKQGGPTSGCPFIPWSSFIPLLSDGSGITKPADKNQGCGDFQNDNAQTGIICLFVQRCFEWSGLTVYIQYNVHDNVKGIT